MRRVLGAAMPLNSSLEPFSFGNISLLVRILRLLSAFREPHVFVYRVRRAAQCRGRACNEPLREEGKRMG